MMAQQQSMFGPTPQELQQMFMQQQQAQDMNQANQWGQGSLGQQISTAGYMGGTMLGRGLQGLGQAAGIIPEDPRIAEARKMMEIKKELMESNIDPSDIDTFYPEMIKKLNAAGFVDQANKAMQQYTQAQTAQGNLEARNAEIEAKKVKADQAKREEALPGLKYMPRLVASIENNPGNARLVSQYGASITPEQPQGDINLLGELESKAAGVKLQHVGDDASTGLPVWQANDGTMAAFYIDPTTNQRIPSRGGVRSKATTLTVNTPKKLVENVLALDEALKDPRQVINDAQKGKSFLNEAVNAQNPNAFEGARTLLAKAVGEGKLSNADIDRVGVTPEIIAGLKNFISGKATGVPTQQMLGQMFALFSILENQATGRVTEATSRVRAAAKAEGRSEEEIDRAFPLPKKTTPAAPKVTKRWNPATGRIEEIK
jgi:hypothetical protein